MIKEKGLLIIISGFSGAGKGTVTKKLVADYDCYSLSISATSRLPRVGEEEGIHYFFISNDEFELKIQNDELIEYAKYVDNYYGTPADYVTKQLEDGKDVILEIEVQGALQVKEKYPDSVLVFMTPPNAFELKKRLKCRGTEDDCTIQKRILRAQEESHFISRYDYVVINDVLEECVMELHSLIQSLHMATSHNINFTKQIQNELKNMIEE